MSSSHWYWIWNQSKWNFTMDQRFLFLLGIRICWIQIRHVHRIVQAWKLLSQSTYAVHALAVVVHQENVQGVLLDPDVHEKSAIWTSTDCFGHHKCDGVHKGDKWTAGACGLARVHRLETCVTEVSSAEARSYALIRYVGEADSVHQFLHHFQLHVAHEILLQFHFTLPINSPASQKRAAESTSEFSPPVKRQNAVRFGFGEQTLGYNGFPVFRVFYDWFSSHARLCILPLKPYFMLGWYNFFNIYTLKPTAQCSR